MGWGFLLVLFPFSQKKKKKVRCFFGGLYGHLFFSLFFSTDCSKYLIIAKLSFQKLQLED